MRMPTINRKKCEVKNVVVISRAKFHPKDRYKVSKNCNISKTKGKESKFISKFWLCNTFEEICNKYKKYLEVLKWVWRVILISFPSIIVKKKKVKDLFCNICLPFWCCIQMNTDYLQAEEQKSKHWMLKLSTFYPVPMETLLETKGRYIISRFILNA